MACVLLDPYYRTLRGLMVDTESFPLHLKSRTECHINHWYTLYHINISSYLLALADSSLYWAHEACFFDQKDLCRLTWSPKRATVENKYNTEACFWELPLKSEKNDLTQRLKSFCRDLLCTMSEPLIVTYWNSRCTKMIVFPLYQDINVLCFF